ncbi:MAG: SUMF1/EgtB/PvdO family nonheme iron enzyme [Candidatus Sericytochromatia bacterium]
MNKNTKFLFVSFFLTSCTGMNLTAIDNPFSPEQTTKNTAVLLAQKSPNPVTTPTYNPNNNNNNINNINNTPNNLFTNGVRAVEIKILDPINKNNPSWYQAPIENARTGKKIVALKGSLIKEITASVTLNDGTKSNNVKWSSSDNTVVNINADNGQISVGQNSAKVTVTAISVVDSSKKDVLEIEVVDQANFTLSESAKVSNVQVILADFKGGTLENKWKPFGNGASAQIGATVPLIATVTLQDGTKNSKVVWESSDESIATVTEDGKVKAIGLGTTSIIARYKTNPSQKGFVDIQVVQEIPDSNFVNTKPTPIPTIIPTIMPTIAPMPTPTPQPTATPTIAKNNELILVTGNDKIKDFYITKYEITQKDWTSVVTANPSTKTDDNLPVFNVSWLNAIKYCNERSKKEGLTVAYDNTGNLLDATGNITTDLSLVKGYRLPTNDEWEYAARGGNKTFNFTYSGNNDYAKIAWYRLNSAAINEVGTKEPNELGLYDMNGNLYEWINDDATDKTGKLVKGGSYLTGETQISSSLTLESSKLTSTQTGYMGFRIVRSK